MNNDFVVGVAVSSSSLLFAIIILSGFLCLAILVSTMRIYKKAGKPSISAIVPIWSQIVLFQIVDIKFWWVFVPVINIVFMFKAYILLAKKFGKGVGFGIGMIFLPMIFIPLLSFYDYVENEEVSEEPIYNPFNEPNVEQVMPSMPIGSEPYETTLSPVEESPINYQEVVEDNHSNLNDDVETLNPTTSSMIMNEETLDDNYVSDNAIENENVIELIPEVLNTLDNLGSNMSNIENYNENSQLNIENSMPIVEPLNEQINIENSNLEEITPVQENVSLTVQDIGDILNNKKELKDVAFGATSQIEEVNYEETHATEVIPVVETDQMLEKNDEIIEMPEMAAKICPACGISLAEDIKFCTACGTQL